MSKPLEEIRQTTYRRLLLAKQIYRHALGHSEHSSALDKMIAMHGFHNAVEVTLRCILLHYEIRAEKQLNIEFETMLSEIDNFIEFKSTGKKLPYRQDIRNLNIVRNLVQHHGHEPEEATLAEARVFSGRFLTRVFAEYFDEDFSNISAVSLVEDDLLRRILKLAHRSYSDANFTSAAAMSKLAFKYASESIVWKFSKESFNQSSLESKLLNHRTSDKELVQFLKDFLDIVGERHKAIEFNFILLESGISLTEFQRFKQVPIYVIPWPGEPKFRIANEISQDDADYSLNFVTETVIKWQQAGYSPAFMSVSYLDVDKFLNEYEEKGPTAKIETTK